MRVTDRTSQCVRRVARRGDVERQQALHHCLHLALVRLPEASHRLFDAQRGVFVHRETACDGSADRRAAGLPEQQCRLRIDVDEDFFHCRNVRPRGTDHFVECAQDGAETLVQFAARHPDHAGGDTGQARALRFDHAIAGTVQARVDPKDAQRGRHATIVPRAPGSSRIEFSAGSAASR
jgi:hypothetical protein